MIKAGARCAAALALTAWLPLAQAGIVFTPHLGEYSKLPPGQYTEFTFIMTEIKAIYGEDGRTIPLGRPFVPAGASTDAALALMKYLWIGNIFRDTSVWYLRDHPQFCRVIGGFGYQQNTEQIAKRGRLFGLDGGASGNTDLFGLCGVYTDDYRVGPLKANGLWAATLKAPVGSYDTDAMLNVGTHYWSYIPQFAFHADLYGRLIVDGTFAYQINENNDTPSFGGTTPTRPADVRNAEINFAWKFNEHWFADVGYGYRESVGPNYYDKYSVNFKDQPLSPQSACDNTTNNNRLGLVFPQELCDNPGSDQFFLTPRPGPYADRGIMGRLGTVGIYYIYRTSSVIQLRYAKPLGGRGAELDVSYDTCSSLPCTRGGSSDIADTPTTLFGVQEAAAVSASPFFEFRFVYLFWAP